MEGFDCRFLNGPHHPFGLAVGPWVIGFGRPVLDAVLGADCPEDMADKSAFSPPVMLNELHAVIGQDGMDLIGDGLDEGLDKAGGDEFCCLPIDPGEHNLRRPIDRHEEEGLAAFMAQLGDVDVEVSDLVGFEPLGLRLIRLRQARDAMTLQTTMEA